MGLIQSDLCTFCSTFRETIDHLFLHCVPAGAFLYDFKSYWFTLTKEQRKIDLKIILIGDTDTQCPLFNCLIGLVNYIYGTVAEIKVFLLSLPVL